MGNWEKRLLDWTYKEIIPEGFLVAQGEVKLSLGNNAFGKMHPNFPAFHVVRVHENYPFQITGDQRTTIRPSEDQRLLAEILRDKNPQVFDSTSFFLTPYQVKLPDNYPGSIVATLDGFQPENGERNLVSLIAADRMGIESGDIITASSVIPPQVPHQFNYWLNHQGRVQAYDRENNDWKYLGRFDIIDTEKIPLQVAQNLEKRFDTKMLWREFDSV